MIALKAWRTRRRIAPVRIETYYCSNPNCSNRGKELPAPPAMEISFKRMQMRICPACKEAGWKGPRDS